MSLLSGRIPSLPREPRSATRLRIVPDSPKESARAALRALSDLDRACVLAEFTPEKLEPPVFDPRTGRPTPTRPIDDVAAEWCKANGWPLERIQARRHTRAFVAARERLARHLYAEGYVIRAIGRIVARTYGGTRWLIHGTYE